MNTNGTLAALDGYFEPREAAWFRTRLAVRLAVPLERDAWIAALKVAASTALAAPPVAIALIAPAAKLTLGTVTGLCCAALPGFAATAWTAADLRHARLLATRGLRQAGAEQRTAWLIGAVRLPLFAGVGALASSVLVALLHAALGGALPQDSPLHGMFAADALTWLLSVALTTALAAGGALLASSPMWERVDWTRFAVWRRVNTPAVKWLGDARRTFARLRSRLPRVTATRRSRPPR